MRDGAGERPPCYFQQWVRGESCSAVYVAAGGRSIMLGVTRQLLGGSKAAENALAYAGSLGPLSIPGTVRRQFLAIGQTLAGSFALAGLFGVNAVVNGGTVYPVEVNPRYTASTEVLERALRIHAVQFHVDSCRHGQLPRGEFVSNRVCGKAIVYARADITVPAEFVDFATKQIERTDWPDLADVPGAGTRIAAGLPVATVLVEASDTMTAEALLAERAQEIERRLYRP